MEQKWGRAMSMRNRRATEHAFFIWMCNIVASDAPKRIIKECFFFLVEKDFTFVVSFAPVDLSFLIYFGCCLIRLEKREEGRCERINERFLECKLMLRISIESQEICYLRGIDKKKPNLIPKVSNSPKERGEPRRRQKSNFLSSSNEQPVNHLRQTMDNNGQGNEMECPKNEGKHSRCA